MLRDDLLDLVSPSLGILLDGPDKRVDLDGDEWTCVAYYVGNVVRIDLKPKNAEPHPASLPESLEPYPSSCQFCGKPIRWGTTHKGNKAPFDAEPPHANHLGSCRRGK